MKHMRYTLLIVTPGIKYYHKFSNESGNKDKGINKRSLTTDNASKNYTRYCLFNENKTIAMILQTYF